MRLLIGKSMFVPDVINLNKLNNSLLILGQVCKQYDIVLIGWCRDNMFDKIHKLPNMRIIRFGINYGKYVILNNIFKLAKEYDYFWYLDHDIIPTEFPQVFDMFNTIDDHNIAAIALNMYQDNRHKLTMINNRINNDFIYPNLQCNYAIALGSFIGKSEFFADMQFDVKHVYYYDDFDLINMLILKKCCVILAKNIYVIHPYEDNQKYIKWKQDQLTNVHDNYFIQIQQSHNFWNNI